MPETLGVQLGPSGSKLRVRSAAVKSPMLYMVSVWSPFVTIKAPSRRRMGL